MPKTSAHIKSHSPKVVEKKKLADGAISFRIRCCGEASTDSWHTLYFHHHDDLVEVMKQSPQNAGQPIMGPKDATEAFIRQELEQHKARVAKLHDVDVSIHALADTFVEAE